MINIQLCCNDDNGTFTGRAIRIDFNEYELAIEDSFYPPRGVRVQFRAPYFAKGRNMTQTRFGRDIWRDCLGLQGYGGNIYWRNIRLSGVDAVGLMNYLMRMKYWRAIEGECYLFDHFNEKKPIVPKEFFASRELANSKQDGGQGASTTEA